MFVAYGNIVCTLQWPSLKAKIGKIKKLKFGRIDSGGVDNENKLKLLTVPYEQNK